MFAYPLSKLLMNNGERTKPVMVYSFLSIHLNQSDKYHRFYTLHLPLFHPIQAGLVFPGVFHQLIVACSACYFVIRKYLNHFVFASIGIIDLFSCFYFCIWDLFCLSNIFCVKPPVETICKSESPAVPT